MKRMTLLLICVLTFIGITLSAFSATADNKDRRENATVSFGQWNPNNPNLTGDPLATPPIDNRFPLDRLVNDPSGGRGNNDEMTPNVVKITEGGSVNFIISGGHVISIYDDKTKPEDINLTNIEAATACATTAGGVLSDANKRIYRGPCFTGRRDGVEVVQFTKPGTYLVICARKNHFFNPTTQEFEMFGFVRVKKDN